MKNFDDIQTIRFHKETIATFRKLFPGRDLAETVRSKILVEIKTKDPVAYATLLDNLMGHSGPVEVTPPAQAKPDMTKVTAFLKKKESKPIKRKK